ncbi:MAG: hypothetical protein H8E39_00120 [Alphaproteobacteria bacterium]|nr:hypothetical protein [Alphaproteobacteria bacterium]
MAKRQTIGAFVALVMFLLATLLMATSLMVLDARAEPAAFLAGFEDLPLMPGLVEDESAGMEFDAPGGRIVESVAMGGVTRGAVLDFYASTLPQLGWRDDGPQGFAREGEVLRLEISENGGVVTVRFALSPESGAQQAPK